MKISINHFMLLTVLLYANLQVAHGQLTGNASASFECEVVIDIYNGFYDWQGSGTSFSGGQKLSTGDKQNIGAVTVANLNDTDGDGISDNTDNTVVSGSSGRNEIDLMKIEVRKKNPSAVLSGNVTVNVVSGNVKLWANSTKVMPVTLTGGSVTFPASQLPKVYYIEAVGVSASLRDIKIQASFNGNTDYVVATAVWLTNTNTWNSNTSTPIPGSASLPDCDWLGLVSSINYRWISASTNQRYGFGPFYSGTNHPLSSTLGSNNKENGGRIMFEFTISPPGADQLVSVDVTRQRKNRSYTISEWFQSPLSINSTDFPWEGSDDNEMPNDDTNQILDEDNGITNNKVYSADRPASFIIEQRQIGFKLSKITFFEFVRVGVKGNLNMPNNLNALRGSRGSDKTAWHCVYYFRRGSDMFKLTADNQSSSPSEPQKSPGFKGDGSIAINVASSSPTEFYSVMYAEDFNEWLICDFDGDCFNISANPNGTSWTFNQNGLNIEILQGTMPFETDDTWLFNVFNSSSKLNDINTGSYDVTTNP